jgi:hypothetical protein
VALHVIWRERINDSHLRAAPRSSELGEDKNRRYKGSAHPPSRSKTSATLLARKWESALLVNVDNDTLRRVLDNPEQWPP